MSKAIKEYDAHLDSKKRITIRGAQAKYYHVSEKIDGTIELSPRVLVHPDEISMNTLTMIDQSIANLKKGKASKSVNIDELKDEKLQ
ncbi:MAG TPA: hypothetical protein DCE78_03895 [Bacteroidetes bacterium]|nr:hypothetical protein [Bacteroidota bacterium]